MRTKLIYTTVAWLFSLGLANADAIYMHSEKNYGGDSVKFDESVADISASPHPISAMSLRIRAMVITSRGWLMCTEPNHQGDCLWARDGSISDLQPWGFARRIRSLQSVPVDLYEPDEGLATRSKAIFFLRVFNRDKDWRLRPRDWEHALKIDGDAPDLRLAGLDFPPAAIVIPGAWAWQLCTEPNYGGRCLTTVNDVDDMAALFSDHILSARRLPMRMTQ